MNLMIFSQYSVFTEGLRVTASDFENKASFFLLTLKTLMHDVEKQQSLVLKSCGVHIARYFKYV